MTVPEAAFDVMRAIFVIYLALIVTGIVVYVVVGVSQG
jgi:hypothetical protein